MGIFDNYRTILHARRGRVLTLTLNNPDKLNAVSEAMHAELASLFTDAAHDPDSDVIVLTGAGRAFSAGGDLEWMQSAIEDPARFDRSTTEAKRLIFSLLECEKPVIAKLNGHAVGLGATIVLFCDVIFAAEEAKIGDPHVAVGLSAGDGGAVIWPQLVGYARAKEFLMTGDLVTAAEAVRIGLINHCVPRAQLDAVVDAFADRLASGALQAIRATKTTVNMGLRQLAQTVMDAGLAHEMLSNRSDDHREAVAAFREKRTPRFGGR